MGTNIMIENKIEPNELRTSGSLNIGLCAVGDAVTSVQSVRVLYAWIALFIHVSQFNFERKRSPIEEY